MEVPEGRKLPAFIIIYFLFTILVPDNPSFYRLFVDTVCCTLSLLSLVLHEMFLRSRPLNQKTILNSQQHLIVYCQAVFTARYWITSAADSLFQEVGISIQNSYPGVFIALLSIRPYAIGLVTAYCSMSVSKLILLISPEIFLNLSARKVFWISLLLALLVPSFDAILNNHKCGGFSKKLENPFESTISVKNEQGQITYKFAGPTGNTTVVKQDPGESAEDVSCVLFPTSVLVIVIIIMLEVIKLILVVLMEVKKLFPKTNRISNIPPEALEDLPQIFDEDSSFPNLQTVATREVVQKSDSLEVENENQI